MIDGFLSGIRHPAHGSGGWFAGDFTVLVSTELAQPLVLKTPFFQLSTKQTQKGFLSCLSWLKEI